MTRYSIHAHSPGSDYYGGRKDSSFTLWPHGAILSGITRGEAAVIERALNAALKAGTLPSLEKPVTGRLLKCPPKP